MLDIKFVFKLCMDITGEGFINEINKFYTYVFRYKALSAIQATYNSSLILKTNFSIQFGTQLGKFFRVKIRLTNRSVLLLISFTYQNYVYYNGYNVNKNDNKRP